MADPAADRLTRTDTPVLPGGGFSVSRRSGLPAPGSAARPAPEAALGAAASEKPARGKDAVSAWAGVTRAGLSAQSSAAARGTGAQTTFRRAATGAARRIDTGTLRRIRDTGALRTMMNTATLRVIMDTSAMRAIMDTAAIQKIRDKAAGKSKVIATIVLSLWVAMSAVIVTLVIGWHGDDNATASPKSTASAHSAATHTATKARQSPAAGQAHALPIARVAAWGPNGTRDADNPSQAARAIDASAATAWRSQWYKTSHFAGLKPGLALLFDMGKTVTVTSIELRLAPGDSSYVIRIGAKAVPGTLTAVASRANSGGTVTIKLRKPAHGRYIELWITQLPRAANETYRESVYQVRINGRG